MTQFRDSFYQFVPPWFSTGNAEKYFYTLELMRDLLMEKCNQAVKIRLPGQGDDSQIPFLAFDRQLVQGPLESSASFVLRLQEAFPTWNESGSAISVLGQLQAYAQGHQSNSHPQFSIVSNPRTLQDGSKVNTWWSLNYDDPIGTEPLLSTVAENFNWDGDDAATWRNWLIVYQYLDAPQATGSSAEITMAFDGSFTDPGHLSSGVWVARTFGGTLVNSPFLMVTGLTGLLPTNVGSVLTLSGSSHVDNNGTFQVAEILTSSSCTIVNPAGVLDAGPLTWSLASYPWIAPGPAFGTAGLVWGEGETTAPIADLGSNVGGVWQPTTLPGAGEIPAFSWGLYVNSLEIVTLRGLVKTWKSAGTYYPNIIISFGASEFSRASTGTGNPDGSFGEVGHNVAGVWVPTRLLSSRFDCYCQGTGRAVACSLENVT